MKSLRWLEIILLIVGLTILATYCIPSESILSVLRIMLGVIFAIFIPGNCLVNILFREKNKIDVIEKTVLSVAMSFGIVGITGLICGLTIGFKEYTPITVFIITLILAITAYILKSRDTKQQDDTITAAKAVN